MTAVSKFTQDDFELFELRGSEDVIGVTNLVHFGVEFGIMMQIQFVCKP